MDAGVATTFPERLARLLVGVGESPPLLLFAGVLPSHGDESRADSSSDGVGNLLVDDRAPGPRGVAGDRRVARPRSHRGGGVRVRVRVAVAGADASGAPTRAPTTSTPPRRHSPMISGDRDTTPAAAASTTTFRSAASSASMAAACSRCHPNRAEGFSSAAAETRSSRIVRARIRARHPRAAAWIATAAFVSRRSSARSASARRIARFLAVSERARAPLACDCSVVAARRNVSSSGTARAGEVDGVRGDER